ncbi:MAG: hypothetical protein JWO95_1451, partial [Verrucomicrobiales bacterium]|nr:hypothetical protein [Verrucomicrobiales bacterium]
MGNCRPATKSFDSKGSMYVSLTGDTALESGVGAIIDLWAAAITLHFAPMNFGVGTVGVVIVLMCQDPCLKLKPRIRYLRAKKKIYADIMLNLQQMREADDKIRQKIIAEAI